MTTADIIYSAISAVITILLGANVYFVQGFFSRTEESIKGLVDALEDARKATNSLSSKLTLLDYQVSELNRMVKNGAEEERALS
jgi:hypothetical protein